MIKGTIVKLNSELPSEVKLVAVSKFHPIEAVLEAYEAGQRLFGESRPQELQAKVKSLQERGLAEDIQWHFIGHLQTNKLKMVLPYASLIHSVDSLRLLEAIDRWGEANGKTINVLLEYFIAQEESKQGFDRQEIEDILLGETIYKNISFKGLMAMASYTDDESQIRYEFQKVVDLNAYLKSRIGEGNLTEQWSELSFGMSGDYMIASSMGATMVRIGTMIFGERKY
jgi:pyridoxal phosphate enzyme (YggS family)